VANEQNLKPFTKGDPRINRGGRPKNFDAARALALKIGNEPIVSKDGTLKTTRFEIILKDWLSSNNFQKQKAVLELAFGKVPDKVDLGEGLRVLVEYVNSPHPATGVPSGASDDTQEPE